MDRTIIRHGSSALTVHFVRWNWMPGSGHSPARLFSDSLCSLDARFVTIIRHGTLALAVHCVRWMPGSGPLFGTAL